MTLMQIGLRLVIALVATLAIALGALRLEQARDGITVQATDVSGVPATLFLPADGGRSPAIVIAHGFAGSQQLMQPFANTLARNGFVAITFDFPGHGRNATAMRGRLDDDAAMSRPLLDALDRVIRHARTMTTADGRVALLGHSMAADIVVRRAIADPEIAATVGVSLFSQGITATAPRNLLVVAGALEPAMLIDEGRRIVAMAAGEPPEEDRTYGDFAAGSARRLVLADGTEHIAVIYARESLEAAHTWLRAAFAMTPAPPGFVDARGPWLGFLFLGIVALAWPLAALLPRSRLAPAGANLAGRRFAIAAVAPALLTPLILWPLPTDFLPILLGDYVAVHFALYGALTLAAVKLAGGDLPDLRRVDRHALAGALLAAGFAVIALGLPIDRYVTSFVPVAGRTWLVLALLCGTLPFFLADEWLARGPLAPRLGYPATKFLFLVSLAIAIALAPRRLFFLIIIVPVILVLFVVHGLLSRWAWKRTGHQVVGAAASALAFAWAIAVTFPVVYR